jgi:hypothetical protein
MTDYSQSSMSGSGLRNHIHLSYAFMFEEYEDIEYPKIVAIEICRATLYVSSAE